MSLEWNHSNYQTNIKLIWTPQGKRKQGRQNTSWWKMVTTELKSGGITWGEAQKLAKDRPLLRETIADLCLTRDEED